MRVSARSLTSPNRSCHAGGRGFESRRSRSRFPCKPATSGRGRHRSIGPRRHYVARTPCPGVQSGANRLLGVARQVAVVAVYRLHRSAHHAGQLKDRDTGRERLGGERVAKLVGAAPAEPRRLERRVPVARPPSVEADVPAPGRREQQRRIEPSTVSRTGRSPRRWSRGGSRGALHKRGAPRRRAPRYSPCLAMPNPARPRLALPRQTTPRRATIVNRGGK
jgi:hypothetical protein